MAQNINKESLEKIIQQEEQKKKQLNLPEEIKKDAGAIPDDLFNNPPER